VYLRCKRSGTLKVGFRGALRFERAHSEAPQRTHVREDASRGRKPNRKDTPEIVAKRDQGGGLNGYLTM